MTSTRGVPWPKSGGGTRAKYQGVPLGCKKAKQHGGNYQWSPPLVVECEKLQKLTIFRARPGKTDDFSAFVSNAPPGANNFTISTLRQPHRHPKKNKIFTHSRAGGGGDLSPRSLPHGTPLVIINVRLCFRSSHLMNLRQITRIQSTSVTVWIRYEVLQQYANVLHTRML